LSDRQVVRQVLVFFDDILIYSQNLEELLEHLEGHQLFAKKSKCSFGMREVEYLGHIITKEGVSTDPNQVEVMLNWPKPSTLRELRGLLGLTGYYRRFIKNYGTLTELLKKNGFVWNEHAQEAFERKSNEQCAGVGITRRRPFWIETDACDVGIGAVLSQGGRPIAYLSKSLGIINIGKSTYE
jgi:RNase H-like domain found in reverse transcriptase